MGEVPTAATYRDLSDFGLPFVTPQDEEFADLVREILSRPQSFAPPAAAKIEVGAVLLNESGGAIVTLSHVWKYTTAEGQTRAHRYSNFGSSMQIDVLTGRAPITQDRASFILPGSKRLITEQGIFGDNLDVLPPEPAQRAGGYMTSGGAGGMRRSDGNKQLLSIELQLDVAVFDDGLCAGPDESHFFESITGELHQRRTTSKKIVEALRAGASRGELFEILRPVAQRRSQIASPDGQPRHPVPLLSMFSHTAIDRLLNSGEGELLTWFEEMAKDLPLKLHRP